MAGKKLESFKISETRKPSVGTTHKGDAPTSGESQSLGFKRIEGILEKEEPAAIRQALERIRDDLAGLEKKGGNKEKAAVKKAMAAVERAADLMDFLFETKESMQAQAVGPAK